VVLVRKGQEFTGDAAALHRGKRAQTLGDWNAEIVAALHHQHRHAPALDGVDRIELPVSSADGMNVVPPLSFSSNHYSSVS
jgi:hypothetical protein